MARRLHGLRTRPSRELLRRGSRSPHCSRARLSPDRLDRDACGMPASHHVRTPPTEWLACSKKRSAATHPQRPSQQPGGVVRRRCGERGGAGSPPRRVIESAGDRRLSRRASTCPRRRTPAGGTGRSAIRRRAGPRARARRPGMDAPQPTHLLKRTQPLGVCQQNVRPRCGRVARLAEATR